MKLISLDTINNIISIQFPYDLSTIGRVKTLPDYAWDKTNKRWTIPATKFHAQKAVEILPDFELGPRVQRLLKEKKEKVWSVSRKNLYPYQNEGVDFIHTNKGTCIVADDVGLGKTVEVLTWLQEVWETEPLRKVLVVAPASVVWKWKHEVAKWTCLSSQVVETTKQKLEDVDIYIMSYAIMTRRAMSLRLVVWDAVIFDEFQAIANPKAQRTRAATAMQTKHTILVSSTPMLNRPIELFVGLNMLKPGAYPSYFKFGKRYCDAKHNGFGWDFKGISNSDELRERLSGIMLRRTKNMVELDLPEKTRTILPVDVPKEEIINAVQNIREDLSGVNKLVKLGILRHAIGMSKVNWAVRYTTELLNYNDTKKVVLYAYHMNVVAELMNGLKEFGVLSITGEIPQKERDSRINNFQNLPHNRVMVITKAGGEGINLYAADTMIFVEREWNPTKEEQAEGRLHRIGQTHPVEIVYLVARGTIDEYIAKLIDDKRDVMAQLMPTDIPETFTIEDDLMNYILKGGIA